MIKLPRLTWEVDCGPIGYPGLGLVFWLNPPLPADEDEDLRVVRLTLTQIDALIRSGELHDAKTLAGLYFYRLARGL